MDAALPIAVTRRERHFELCPPLLQQVVSQNEMPELTAWSRPRLSPTDMGCIVKFASRCSDKLRNLCRLTGETATPCGETENTKPFHPIWTMGYNLGRKLDISPP